jgi:dipeptidyl aminopeptidase/acylaminoacyl peptidase
MTGNLFHEPFWQKFFGKEEVPERLIRDASPVYHVTKKSPPILCLHSINDELVPLIQSQRIIDTCRKVKADCELYTFNGKGEKHGIWRDDMEEPVMFTQELEDRILEFFEDVQAG